MNIAESFDFPFLADLPVREQKKVENVWDELKQIAALISEKGMPVPIPMCASALRVSQARIHQLIEGGRLETMSYGGRTHVTKRSLYAFANQERPSGRPLGWRKYPEK
jgi:hypothetical protein